MYNYSAYATASPTNTASSGQSEHSSAWWSPASAPGSVTSMSSGNGSGCGFGQSASPSSSNACTPLGFGQMQTRLDMGLPQSTSALGQTSQIRPPHAPYKYVSISTQYVYAAPQRTPMLARVSIVDYRGNTLYDTFVRPTHQVDDFRTSTTGVLPEHLLSHGALALSAVREQVSAFVSGRIIIGHSLWIHFSLLGMTHPAINTRDVALYLPFHRSVSSFNITPLKSLVSHLMRRKIGKTQENPVEEARASLDLFRSHEDPWEDEVRSGEWPCALPPSAFKHCFS